MSDLKHRNDGELVSIIKEGAIYRSKLRDDISLLNSRLSSLRQRLHGSEERSRWAIHYLKGLDGEIE